MIGKWAVKTALEALPKGRVAHCWPDFFRPGYFGG